MLATWLVLVGPPAYADSTRAAIEAVAAEMQAIANRGDSKAIAALYTKDAELLPEGSDPIKGTAAIQKYFQDGFDSDGFGHVRFKTREVYDQGNAATEVGEFWWDSKTTGGLDHGNYIVVYLKVDGRWKLHRDMFTSSVPTKK